VKGRPEKSGDRKKRGGKSNCRLVREKEVMENFTQEAGTVKLINKARKELNLGGWFLAGGDEELKWKVP